MSTATITTHTPGPWRTQRAGRSDRMIGQRGWNPDDPQQCARVVVSDSRTLCRLPDPMPWLGDDELDANAALIAAAPELLAVVSDLAQWAETRESRFSPQLLGFIERARAAVAAAEAR